MGATPTQRKATGPLARFAQARKSGGRLLPDVERYLMGLPNDRAQDVIHPSEVADPEFCPRAIYHRLNGVRPPVEPHRFQLENIFDHGHAEHDKWQTRWWRMGVLWGRWQCKHCDAWWFAVSPVECPGCGAGTYAIRYREVPVADPLLRMSGHSDGEIRDAYGNVMIEIKTIGEGTVRIEAPKLYAAHRMKALDIDGKETTVTNYPVLFRQLRQPFLKHRRQGWIYLALRPLTHPDEPPVEGMNFIYESKFTQATKEFLVKLDTEQVGEIFADCRAIVRAVELQREPDCRKGRHERCDLCTPYVKEVRGESTPQTGTTDSRAGDAQRPRTRRPVITGHPEGTGRGGAGDTERPERSRRSRPDRAADDDQSLGGLLRRSAGARRG